VNQNVHDKLITKAAKCPLMERSKEEGRRGTGAAVELVGGHADG
jgi:hypothetical protein